MNLDIIQILLGIGAVASGFILIRTGLRSRNIAVGILQLVAGVVLLIGGGYTIVSAVL